jgi:hypothetical protein
MVWQSCTVKERTSSCGARVYSMLCKLLGREIALQRLPDQGDMAGALPKIEAVFGVQSESLLQGVVVRLTLKLFHTLEVAVGLQDIGAV